MTETIAGHHPTSSDTVRGKDFRMLILAALGVVYGDIGTSPLYAIRETFHPSHGLALSPENIFGILSLVFWSLTLVVSLKYLTYILRADQQGEGGITALLALLLPKMEARNSPQLKLVVVILALFGAGLLLGDAMITPAISVLSAIEGLQVATPAFQPIVVPLTLLILFALFWVQKRGTASIGAVFGPAMVVWFLTLAVIALPWIAKRPEILGALNPVYAVSFFVRNGMQGFLVLSSVVLCITGAEALYADMGHFGKRPIRTGWFWFVYPTLVFNYLGQGALVLEQGSAVIENTFYGLVSGWRIYPLVIISTIATVIASQALISGAFSLTFQSVQLGYLPRTAIRYTSRQMEGQIYIPKVNLFLMISCIILVLAFGSSSNLAGAYGVAVTGTMTITSILFGFVALFIWNWSLWVALPVVATFLAIDSAFLGANLMKIFHGGWVPVSVAFVVLALMTTWKTGRSTMGMRMRTTSVSLVEFFRRLDEEKPHRVKGTAVFMTLTKDIAPSVLLHHYKHNQILHQQVLLVSVLPEHSPEVPLERRVRVTPLEHGFVKVVAKYGYMESPDMKEILDCCEAAGTKVDRKQISYYLGRESFVTQGDQNMALWRKKLFVLMSRNARSAAEYFNLPADHVIEIGSQMKI